MRQGAKYEDECHAGAKIDRTDQGLENLGDPIPTSATLLGSAEASRSQIP